MRRDTLARADDPGSIARLKSEFTELKQLLADAICAKFAQLQAETDKTAKDEQARLDEKYGRNEYLAEETEVLKRARANCEYVRRMVERCKTESVESLFLDISRYLLNQ
jgi:hypothetical protein